MSGFEWIKLETKGTTPSPRYGHGMTFVGQIGYVFGGACGGANPDASPDLFNDMYSLDVSTSPATWKKIEQKGAIPVPREGHSLVSVGKILYLFGGTGKGDVCLNDFFSFDTTNDTWSVVKSTGTVPSKRNNHSCTVIHSKIFIFGGFLDGVAGNDVHIFDTKTSSWQSPKVSGKVPIERCDHSWSAIGNKIVLFGGAGDEVWYNDLHVFHSETLTWSTPQVTGTLPAQRDYHVSVALNDRAILIFGGANDSDPWRHFNDVHLFNIEKFTWIELKPSGQIPHVRWGHTGAVVNQKVYYFGGTSQENFYNDVWVLQTHEETPSKPPRNTLIKTQSTAGNPTTTTPSSTTSSSTTSTSTSTTNPIENQGVVPIPSKRTTYTTPTPIPSPRKVVNADTPDKVVARDFSAPKNHIMEVIEGMFNEIKEEYLKLDQDRAQFNVEKAAFAEEKRINQELFEKQQKELTEMVEQHRIENTELLRKRQAQYEEKVAEINQKQEALNQNEAKFKQTLEEFDAKKKNMEAVMAQFSAFKT